MTEMHMLELWITEKMFGTFKPRTKFLIIMQILQRNESDKCHKVKASTEQLSQYKG